MSETIQINSISLETAQKMANAALAYASSKNFKMNIVVCDHAGHPLVTLRMPGAPLPAYDFAQRKAATAAYYGIPTADWKEKLESRPIVMTGLANHDNVAMGNLLFLTVKLLVASGLRAVTLYKMTNAHWLALAFSLNKKPRSAYALLGFFSPMIKLIT